MRSLLLAWSSVAGELIGKSELSCVMVGSALMCLEVDCPSLSKFGCDIGEDVKELIFRWVKSMQVLKRSLKSVLWFVYCAQEVLMVIRERFVGCSLAEPIVSFLEMRKWRDTRSEHAESNGEKQDIYFATEAVN